MKVVKIEQLQTCLRTIEESWLAKTRLGKEMLDMVKRVIDNLPVFEVEDKK